MKLFVACLTILPFFCRPADAQEQSFLGGQLSSGENWSSNTDSLNGRVPANWRPGEVRVDGIVSDPLTGAGIDQYSGTVDVVRRQTWAFNWTFYRVFGSVLRDDNSDLRFDFGKLELHGGSIEVPGRSLSLVKGPNRVRIFGGELNAGSLRIGDANLPFAGAKTIELGAGNAVITLSKEQAVIFENDGDPANDYLSFSSGTGATIHSPMDQAAWATLWDAGLLRIDGQSAATLGISFHQSGFRLTPATGGRYVLSLDGAAEDDFTAAIPGADLVLQSNGFQDGTEAVLNESGFVGAYVRVNHEASQRFSIDLSAAAPDGQAVVVDVHIGGKSWRKAVTPGDSSFSVSDLKLPAGLHSLRIELANGAMDLSKTLRIRRVSFGAGAGVDLINVDSDANALQAADDYIANWRRSPQELRLVDAEGQPVPEGTEVRIKLKQHDFNFGIALAGTSSSVDEYGVEWLYGNDSRALLYRDTLLNSGMFNMVSMTNVGKWRQHEWERDVETYGAVDDFLRFAAENELRTRWHAVFWDTNAPYLVSWGSPSVQAAQKGLNLSGITSHSEANGTYLQAPLRLAEGNSYLGRTNYADVYTRVLTEKRRYVIFRRLSEDRRELRWVIMRVREFGGEEAAILFRSNADATTPFEVESWLPETGAGAPVLTPIAGDQAERDALLAEFTQRRQAVAARAHLFDEADGINETYHKSMLYGAFDIEGVADQWSAMVTDFGSAAKSRGERAPLIFMNEFSVNDQPRFWDDVSLSREEQGNELDLYFNWYRRHVQELQALNGPDTIGGIGLQSHLKAKFRGRAGSLFESGAFSAAYYRRSFEMLSVLDTPLAVTEWSITQFEDDVTPLSETEAASILEQSMRICFGTHLANGFTGWHFMPMPDSVPAEDRNYGIVDQNLTLNQLGKRWQELVTERWHTDLLLTVGTDGQVTLPQAFHGTYTVSFPDQPDLVGEFKTRSGNTGTTEVRIDSEMRIADRDLLAYFPFDEASGYRVNDASMNFPALTRLRGEKWQTGHQGSALDLRWHSYFEIPPAKLRNLDQEFSISFWAKSENTDQRRRPLINLTGPDGRDILRISVPGGGNEALLTLDDSEILAAPVEPALLQNRWHHWNFQFSAQNQRYEIYLDGTLLASLTAPVIDFSDVTTARIGASVIDDIGYRGGLDELRIYRRALSPAETQELAGGALNNTPVARDDQFSLKPSESIQFDPRLNDADLESSLLSVVDFTQPDLGELNLDAQGKFNYRAPQSTDAVTRFRYRVSDGEQLSNWAEVTLIISQNLSRPVAEEDLYFVNNRLETELRVLENDRSPNGGELEIIKLGEARHGSLSIGVGGALFYRPTEGYVGTDQFSYVISDGQSVSLPTTVKLSIFAGEFGLIGYWNLNELSSGSFKDRSGYGNDLLPDLSGSGSLVEGAMGGAFQSAEGAGASRAEINTPDWDGSFTVSVWVKPAAESPQGTLFSMSQQGIAQIGFSLPRWGNRVRLDTPSGRVETTLPDGLLANEWAHWAASFDAPSGQWKIYKNGELVSSGQLDAFTGQASVTHCYLGSNRGRFNFFNGQIDELRIYRNARNLNNLRWLAKLPNRPPLAFGESFRVSRPSNPDPRISRLQNTAPFNVLENDYDPEGSALTLEVTRPTSFGSLSWKSGGGFSYTPNAGFWGWDSFEYRVFDGQKWSQPTRAELKVERPYSDSDQDGIADAFEWELAGNLDLFSLTSDSDGDGHSDRAELAAGTDPLNRDSFLACRIATSAENRDNLTLKLKTEPGKAYRLWYNDSLNASSWEILGSEVYFADTQQLEITIDQITASEGYFRVEVVQP